VLTLGRHSTRRVNRGRAGSEANRCGNIEEARFLGDLHRNRALLPTDKCARGELNPHALLGKRATDHQVNESLTSIDPLVGDSSFVRERT